MSRTDNAAIGLYHGYLNAIHSYLHGYYARLNAWQDLAPCEGNAELIKDATDALDFVIELMNKLFQGETIDLQKEQESNEVQAILSLFQSALYYYDSAPPRIAELLFVEPGNHGSEELGELIGFLVDQAHARDHFIKGLVQYGDAFQIPEVADRWRQHLLSTQNQIREASLFYTKALNTNSDPEYLMPLVQREAFLLPGGLCCKAADLRRLEGVRNGNYNFQTAGFPEEEAVIWGNLEFDPLNASYWQAFGFGPQDAVEWIKHGFTEADWAGGFYLRGIDLPEALKWVEKDVTASQAAELRQSGVQVDEFYSH